MEIGHAVLDEPRGRGIRERFERTAGRLARALGAVGVDARESGRVLPRSLQRERARGGEAGEIGQRVVGGGSHTGVVLVIEGDDRINAVLDSRYAALSLDWDPTATGSVRSRRRMPAGTR